MAEDPAVPDDLSRLPSLEEEKVRFALQKRFEDNKIHTHINALLVVINPYQMLPIYDQSALEAYNTYGQANPGPHVFGVAAATYRGLLDARSQSVIISGESGAGKTETAKRFLQFLAYAATQGSGSSNEVRGPPAAVCGSGVFASGGSQPRSRGRARCHVHALLLACGLPGFLASSWLPGFLASWLAGCCMRGCACRVRRSRGGGSLPAAAETSLRDRPCCDSACACACLRTAAHGCAAKARHAVLSLGRLALMCSLTPSSLSV